MAGVVRVLETRPRGLTKEGPYTSDGRWGRGGVILVLTIPTIAFTIPVNQFREVRSDIV